ncbi:MAG: hypothetical protein AB1805_04070 [Nitrospirota bacterium]
MRQLYAIQLAIATGVLIVIVTTVFALVQNPELLDLPATASVRAASDTPHPIEGYRPCDSCHGMKGESPYPLNHTGWSDESCTRCHIPSALPQQGEERQ